MWRIIPLSCLCPAFSHSVVQKYYFLFTPFWHFHSSHLANPLLVVAWCDIKMVSLKLNDGNKQNSSQLLLSFFKWAMLLMWVLLTYLVRVSCHCSCRKWTSTQWSLRISRFPHRSACRSRGMTTSMHWSPTSILSSPSVTRRLVSPLVRCLIARSLFSMCLCSLKP